MFRNTLEKRSDAVRIGSAREIRPDRRADDAPVLQRTSRFREHDEEREFGGHLPYSGRHSIDDVSRD